MKLVYLSPVPWDSISQRPHFFIQHAFHAGIKEILWVEPYPGRLPNLQDLVPGRHAKEPSSRRSFKNLSVLPVSSIFPIEPLHNLFKLINRKSLAAAFKQISVFKDENTILVIGKPSLLALKLCKELAWRKKYFDAMDNYPAFFKGYSSHSMNSIEKKVASSVDTIICTSHPLIEKFSNHNNVELCLNACTDDFVKGRHDKNLIAGHSITFGYVGTIANWFDWAWVIELAELNPTSAIRIIGPLKTLKPRYLPHNISIEKPVSHDEVPSLLSEIDIGLIPFRVNDITKYVDPIKFYEYAASGIPILSTKFGEMLWHHNEVKGENDTCPYEVPRDTLYFNEGRLNNITWEHRFNDFFPKMLE